MAEGHREDASVDDEGGAGDTDGRSWAPSGAEVLRERWFACSSALGWASPAEWPHPTVDRVCAAICARGDGTAVEKALARWAGARAGAGVGLAETLSDLAALHTAVSGVLRGGEPTDGVPRLALATDAGPSPRQAGDARPNGGRRGLDGARLLRAVALAWTDVACGDLAETAAVDPLSGLASVRYLRTRLAEVYRAARARGRRVPDEHALVVITLTVHGWTRVAPLSLAGEAIGVVFDAGESVAVVGRATIVVLAPREDLAERARVLRRLLARRLPPEVGVSRAPSVRIAGLPATHDGACAVLERLRDDDRGPRTPTAGA